MFIKYIILYVYINLLCSLKIPKVSQISNVRKNMFYNLNVDQIIFDRSRVTGWKREHANYDA